MLFHKKHLYEDYSKLFFFFSFNLNIIIIYFRYNICRFVTPTLTIRSSKVDKHVSPCILYIFKNNNIIFYFKYLCINLNHFNRKLNIWKTIINLSVLFMKLLIV